MKKPPSSGKALIRTYSILAGGGWGVGGVGVGALLSLSGIRREVGWGGLLFEAGRVLTFYFGGARSKGFATLRKVSKLPFF